MRASRLFVSVLSMAGFSATADDVPSGKVLFEELCATCHQYDGGGVPMMQPEIIGIARANGVPGGVIEMILKGSEAIPAEESVSMNEMPGFPELSNEEIARIATYVRTNFTNKGGAVSAADVARQRSAN